MREFHPYLTLMNGLYSPAVLGTGLVLFLLKIVSADRISSLALDLSNYIAIILLLYFSVSFLMNQSVAPSNYRVGAFCCDFCEILLVFLAFFFLKFTKPAIPETNDYQWFYLAMLPIPLLQQIWNRCVGIRSVSMLYVALVGTVPLLVGFVVGYRWMWFNTVITFSIAAVVSFYFAVLLKGEANKAVNPSGGSDGF